MSGENYNNPNAIPVWPVPGPSGTKPGSVSPVFNSCSIASVTTSATGANFTLFAAAECLQAILSNNSGVTLEFQIDGTGATFPIFDQSYVVLPGISDMSQVGVRRVDQSNTQVSMSALVCGNV